MNRRFASILPRLGVAFVALSGAVFAQGLRARQVAAPAEDILSGLVRLPDPARNPWTSRAAILPLRFERSGAGWAAEVEVPVERGGDLAVVLLSPDAGTWRVLARAPGASFGPIEDAVPGVERNVAPAGLELPGWIVDRYDLRGAAEGAWNLRVEASDGRRVPAEAWLLASADRDLAVEAFATTLELVADGVIGIAARISASAGAPTIVEDARVVLESGGSTTVLPMADDGRHEDGRAGDGLFGVLLPEGLRGEVRTRVELRGRTRRGAAFLRSTQITFPVLDRRLFLDGTARAEALGDGRIGIAIGALPLAPAAQLHVSAEVWGHDSTGASVPVCWLSRMTFPEERSLGHGGGWTLPLALDTRWIDVARAMPPFELRQVRVQDPDSEVVFDRTDRMPLAITSMPVRTGPPAREIVPEMLTGSAAFVTSSTTPTGPRSGGHLLGLAPALILVHGYCSGGAVWPAADFTQPKTVFLDPNQNRTHDEFAQLLGQHGQNAGLTSFGIVAHSQGGCAALHLLTYYASGLDLARGGRKIQSVATPYQGTPLASWGGFACGVNNDMTPAGAATWLSGIPSWARAEVSYWTTANSGSVCNSITSLLLAAPEDGTVEMFRGQLTGANSMGHVVGWCHTTGMSNPANYTDHPRNAAMNAAAAR